MKLNWNKLFGSDSRLSDSDLHKSLSLWAFRSKKILKFLLPITFILTIVFLNCSLWSNFLTGIEAIAGFVGIWLTLEIFRIGMELSIQQTKVLDGQTKVIDNVHSITLVSLKENHSNQLRSRYEFAKLLNDPVVFKSWEFSWRFETWTTMTIQLMPTGSAELRVIGSNNPPLETDLEKKVNAIYTVDIDDIRDNTTLRSGLAYCWCINGKYGISNSANEIDLLTPIVPFEITGRIGQGGAIGNRPANYVRLMELKDFAEANVDRE
jgi:hypothetical protein